MLSIDDRHIRTWDVDYSSGTGTGISAKQVNKIAIGELQKLTVGRWYPHDTTQIATCNDASIKAWDLRSLKTTFSIDNAHGQFVRDLDFNPNKPYYFVSGGDDCKLKFWDMRKYTEPLKVMSSHSHWVWSVKYNHHHDQLVLSSSSDSVVKLWNVWSLSSAPLGELEENKHEHRDKLISTYEEHEDSVYSVSWSAADAWIFGSLSYDGKCVINHIPQEEKDRILL